MAAITLDKLNKHYGSVFHAVKDVDLEIADKEFVALVGPSGCGKSTTLRMIAGLEDISSGEIRIGERVVNHLPPRDRDVAMVFQNYALYQHMSVYDNLAFGLRNKKMPESEIRAAIDRATGMLGLHDLLKRKPRQLSGGQQQRVALGRCIVRNPLVFLFGTPLAVYGNPVNKFVAGFIGAPAMNFLDVTIAREGDTIVAQSAAVKLAVI